MFCIISEQRFSFLRINDVILSLKSTLGKRETVSTTQFGNRMKLILITALAIGSILFEKEKDL